MDVAPATLAIGLTGRETEALLLLSQGLTAASVARRMSCSISTANKHLGNVYRKLGVNDRLDAVLIAQRAGLLAPTPGRPPHVPSRDRSASDAQVGPRPG